MTNAEQLQAWVKGDLKGKGAAAHVHTLLGGKHEVVECVPDFSCCTPALLASEEERKIFLAGDEGVRNMMLGTFLGRLLEHNSMNVKSI